MRAAIFNGPGSILVGNRPDPSIETPTDAIVRVAYGCVCGSDLWYYRGQSPHAAGSIGHEFIGTIEELGPEVASLQKGDLVVAPFLWSDGTCALCRAGWPSQWRSPCTCASASSSLGSPRCASSVQARSHGRLRMPYPVRVHRLRCWP